MANLADLQAELLRKKSELAAKSGGLGEGNYARAEKREKTPSSNSIFAKKNKGVAGRDEKDAEQKAEEDKTYENARKKLEMKAKMYDKLSKGENGVLDNDQTGLEDRVMVDFQQKALDHFQEQKAKIEKIREEEEKKKKIKDLGDGKVEFTDSLGRTRIVEKGDVKDLMEMDKEFRQDAEADNPHSTFQRMKFIKSTEFQEEEDETAKGPEAKMKERLLVSSDMQREELRQKWEREEESLLDKGDVHYQDVQFDEIRDLGTGYFAFSTSDREREKQKEDLTDIREETLTARERAERVKAKRAEMMKARLAKVKARRGIEDTTKEEEEAVAKKTAEEEEEAAKKAERERLYEDQLDLARRAKIRDWDQGKEATLQTDKEGPSWEQKTEEMRSERNEEFAPPQFYGGDKSATANYKNKKRKKTEEEEDEDPVAKGLRNLKNLFNL